MGGGPIAFPEGPRPRNIGHRGAAGHAPENTIHSFRKALALGADVFELDVHATRDGTVVVSHDETLARMTDGEGPIRRKMYSEVAKLDGGFRWTADGKTHPFRGRGIRVPTLLELLETFPDVPLNIEIKQADPPIVDRVVRLLERADRTGSVNLAAENPAIMEAIRASGWRGATGFSMADVVAFMDARANGRLADYAPPGVALQVPERWRDVEVVTPDFVDDAHRCGIEVHVWTVNEPPDMDRLLGLGVDGLVTDFPERVRAAIARIPQARTRA
jgi:glycerophosphoryl diester phosphodiesterase